jgi:hypothetical protein
MISYLVEGYRKCQKTFMANLSPIPVGWQDSERRQELAELV